jgi:hypothetical protein
VQAELAVTVSEPDTNQELCSVEEHQEPPITSWEYERGIVLHFFKNHEGSTYERVFQQVGFLS